MEGRAIDQRTSAAPLNFTKWSSKYFAGADLFATHAECCIRAFADGTTDDMQQQLAEANARFAYAGEPSSRSG